MRFEVSVEVETYCVSATKINRLMFFSEIMAVYCENQTKHTNTFLAKIAGFWHVKAGSTHNNHWALKG
jgi:hypothetical protein